MENVLELKISFREFTEICRICLGKQTLQPLTADLLELFYFLTKYEETMIELPQNICMSCVSYLEDILTFVNKCKSNETLLRRIFEERHLLKDEESDVNNDLEILKSHTLSDEDDTSEPKEKPFKLESTSLHCSICDRNFPGKVSFTNHMRVHQNQREHKKYLCYYCGKKFIKNSHLERHIRSHTGNKPYQCQSCKKCFTQSNDLKRHLLTHTREKVFQCLQCDKAFHQKSCLHNHIQTHSSERNFQCYFCEKRFTTKAYLEVHIRTHTGQKPYRCDHCNKQFQKKSGLTNHLLTHSGEKRHKCTVCDKKFIQSNHLKEHLRVHSGEKPFVCSYCGKTFAYSSTHKVHLRQHTGEKPFVCSLCNKSFHDTSNWRRHVNRHNSRSGKSSRKKGRETNFDQSPCNLNTI